MNKYSLALSSLIIFCISLSAMGSILPKCEKKAVYVNYQELPQNLRTKAEKMRELQSQQKIFSQEERRKRCPQESAIVEAIFNKLVAASNLQNYISGEQSLYPLVNCNNNEIDGYTLFGTVVISAGILRQTENEGEIAFVIGHEIGHHLLAHDLSGSAASPTTEWAADRVGLSLMVNAGYDSDSILTFFNKLDPQGNKTHGKPAQRIENLTHCD